MTARTASEALVVIVYTIFAVATSGRMIEIQDAQYSKQAQIPCYGSLWWVAV
jgi:hypothetical protein